MSCAVFFGFRVISVAVLLGGKDGGFDQKVMYKEHLNNVLLIRYQFGFCGMVGICNSFTILVTIMTRASKPNKQVCRNSLISRLQITVKNVIGKSYFELLSRLTRIKVNYLVCYYYDINHHDAPEVHIIYLKELLISYVDF